MIKTDDTVFWVSEHREFGPKDSYGEDGKIGGWGLGAGGWGFVREGDISERATGAMGRWGDIRELIDEYYSPLIHAYNWRSFAVNSFDAHLPRNFAYPDSLY